ncbi:MAG: hypothetical protein WC781_01535 [Candidatus Pacearchaeota archaeon]|jgi:hypothetical protein
MKRILKNNKELNEQNLVKRKKFEFNNKFWIGAFIVVLVGVLFVFFINIGNFGTTGRVSLTVTTTYLPNETLKGSLALSLKSGELIPSDSIISIKIGSNYSNYTLSGLTSEAALNGDYYAIGQDLSGSGEGYGILGEKISYPEVSFTMNVISSGTSEGTGTEGISGETSEETNTSTETSETSTEETQTTTESTPESTSSETPETTTESIPESTSSETPETTTESTPESTSSETPETTTESTSETSSTESTTESTSEVGETSPITGETINEVGEVSGVTSFENPYTYTLESGQTAEIVSSSQPVSLSIENGVVTVTTDYSETEEGFGEDYLGDITYEININLSSLNLNPEEGEMIVSVISQNKEILSVSKNLVLLETSTASNETLLANLTSNLTANVTFEDENVSSFVLSDEQKFKLKMITGEEDAEIVKSEILNDRLIIRFEIGEYWIEKTYDAGLSRDILKSQISLDKAKWLMYLAQKLMEVAPSPVDAPEYVENLSG